MDLASFWRERIEGLLIKASWVSRARQELGLEGVSPVWSDNPAWYFWLREWAGAYSLEMEEAFAERVLDQTVRSGVFAIKCYPHPKSLSFASFSPEERHLLQGEAFDSSNTPCFEAQQDIPAGLFTVAGLECAVDEDQTWHLLSLESCDLLRTTSGAGQGASLIRNVPGWQLGYRLFERLVSLYSFSLQQAPVRIVLCSAPGFASQLNPDKTVVHIAAEELTHFNLFVLFKQQRGGKSRSAGSYLDIRLQELKGRVEMDLECSGIDSISNRFPAALPGWISSHWWTMAQVEMRSELASACGCCQGH